MVNDLSYLLIDPRPNLPDTNLWVKLLRAIPSLENRDTAEKLHKRIWTLRSIGVSLKYIGGVWRFVPILDDTGGYKSEKEFEEDKKLFLTPFAAEISDLLRKVTGQ